jgi:2',3'-cyclic-nucleotide 2'-phosphodiesterase (5'-nucleotidase family)
LEVDGGEVVRYQHRLIEVAETIEPDPTVATMITEALAPYAADLGRVVGEVSTALNRNTSLESTMDNFLLASVREAAGTPLAFCNGWRWGAPVRAGSVTLNDLYNIMPMSVPITTVELTGLELIEMLEENLERTYSADPLRQMGGYVKRCQGLTAYIKIENPPGTRIQKLFVGNEEVQPASIYRGAYLTMQAVPEKYGRNREVLRLDAHDAMLAYLDKYTPVSAELRGTFVAT